MNSPKARIRPATIDDGPVVEALWSALMSEEAEIDERFRPSEDSAGRWRVDYPEWLNDSTHAMFVAEKEGAVAGFVSARLWGPAPILEPATEVFVEFLYVAPTFRRQGLGRALVSAATEWGAGVGATQVRIRSLFRSGAASAFWKECGADPFGVESIIEIGDTEVKPSKSPIGFRGNPA